MFVGVKNIQIISDLTQVSFGRVKIRDQFGLGSNMSGKRVLTNYFSGFRVDFGLRKDYSEDYFLKINTSIIKVSNLHALFSLKLLNSTNKSYYTMHKSSRYWQSTFIQPLINIESHLQSETS